MKMGKRGKRTKQGEEEEEEEKRGTQKGRSKESKRGEKGEERERRDLMAPMTFKVALMAASWLAPMEASMVASMASVVASMASMVAPMAPVVASMASLASMVETLDWLKRMTAESRSDGERADGLTTRIVLERADGLTHKIREELTVGWILFVDVVQVVTWARTKRGASLVDSVALMAWIASTLALMVTLMVASMVASMASVASSRSNEETTAKGDRVGLKEKCQNERRCHGSTMALMVASMGLRWGFDGFDGFDGGFEGFGGCCDGIDGFDDSAVGVVESDGSRAQKR